MPHPPGKNAVFLLAGLCLLALVLSMAGCGYHLAGEAGRDLPPMRLSLSSWQNQTSELAVETELLQELTRWCNKAPFLSLTDGQDAFVLRGKIVSLRSPGRTYSATDQVVELQAELTVSYSLTDPSGKILFQEPGAVWTENYPLGADAIRTRDNRRRALHRVFRDLAEEIYMRILIAYDRGEKG